MYKPILLEYQFNSLEPYIGQKTMNSHYNRHYLTYLNKLNDLLNNNNFDFSLPVKDLLLSKNIDRFPISDRNSILFNAGGVVNHEMYFNGLTPNYREPLEPIKSIINKEFGSLENFFDELLSNCLKLNGSGYTFLVLDNGRLKIYNFPNQDSPYSYGFIPIMNIDLWEHAYYLDYLNDKRSYVINLFKIINFEQINNNYINALKNKNS